MKIKAIIDTTNTKYDLLDLSHNELERIYQALSMFYKEIFHLSMKEIEDELPQKICKIMEEQNKII